MKTTLTPLQQQLFQIVLLDYRDGKIDLQYCHDYSLADFWLKLSHEFNKMALDRGVGTITELEFHSYGTMLERKFLRQKKKGKNSIDGDLSAIFFCQGCQERIPVFINNALDFLKPRGSRSQSGARNLNPSAESASVEMANSRLTLVKRLEDLVAKAVITVPQMVKLLEKFNDWEENLCWITMLLNADDMQFTEYLKAILNEMDK